MNAKIAIIAVLVVGILFVAGCGSSNPAYNSYNQPQPPAQQGGQPNQYVGGGCGVAPSADYSETPLTKITKIFNRVENF